MTLTYLTLAELETLAWEFRDQGVSILAAGDVWLLRANVGGVETTFRAHRAGVSA